MTGRLNMIQDFEIVSDPHTETESKIHSSTTTVDKNDSSDCECRKNERIHHFLRSLWSGSMHLFDLSSVLIPLHTFNKLPDEMIKQPPTKTAIYSCKPLITCHSKWYSRILHSKTDDTKMDTGWKPCWEEKNNDDDSTKPFEITFFTGFVHCHIPCIIIQPIESSCNESNCPKINTVYALNHHALHLVMKNVYPELNPSSATSEKLHRPSITMIFKPIHGVQFALELAVRRDKRQRIVLPHLRNRMKQFNQRKIQSNNSNHEKKLNVSSRFLTESFVLSRFWKSTSKWLRRDQKDSDTTKEPRVSFIRIHKSIYPLDQNLSKRQNVCNQPKEMNHHEQSSYSTFFNQFKHYIQHHATINKVLPTSCALLNKNTHELFSIHFQDFPIESENDTSILETITKHLSMNEKNHTKRNFIS